MKNKAIDRYAKKIKHTMAYLFIFDVFKSV